MNSKCKLELEELSKQLYKFEYIEKHNVLYHYTDINGVKGILDNRHFWVSHQNFMNDASESKYLNYLVDTVLKQMIEQSKGERTIVLERLKTFEENRFRLDHGREHLDNRIRSKRLNAYILSLSTNYDSLTLWSSYSKFSGYNIGFKFDDLLMLFNDANPNNFVIHSKVIYSENVQFEIINNEINNYMNLYFKHDCTIDDEAEIFNALNVRLWMYSLIFKGWLFHQEEEYRVIFFPSNEASVRKYRTCNDIIIPFIEQPHENTLNLPVANITIAPKNNSDIAVDGLVSYLFDLGYNIDDIPIYKSNLPLRY